MNYWVLPNTELSEWIPHCGDSRRAGSEAWDDGNTANGDGWSSTWTIETGASWYGGSITSKDTWVFCNAGYYQNTLVPTQWIIKCGDGLRAGSEKCDDGNTSSGDGCSSDCSSVEAGFVCSGGSPTSKDTWTKWGTGFYQNDATNPTLWVSKWGDGIKVSSEACDDGNLVSGDGCSSVWTIESRFVWSGGSLYVKDTWIKWTAGFNPNTDQSQWIPKWGDGLRVSYEHCDDGNTVEGDGWSSDCMTIESGWAWFGGYFGVADVWVQCDLGYNPNPDYSTCIGASVPRDVKAMAAAAQIGAYMGIASNLVLTVFSSSSSSTSNSFGLLNQIQLVILLPLIDAYIPEKIYDYLKSMNTSLLNLNFLPTNNSDSTISFKSLFNFKQPNSYLYLL